jgi:hypothetical protein
LSYLKRVWHENRISVFETTDYARKAPVKPEVKRLWQKYLATLFALAALIWICRRVALPRPPRNPVDGSGKIEPISEETSGT